MPCPPMPFLSGPVLDQTGTITGRQDPPKDLLSVVPLSKVQQALWLDYLTRPQASHYHLRLEVDLSDVSPALERLLQVIQTVGSQHPMLRTTFHLDSDNQMSSSFMAVHPPDTSIQSFEIVNDEGKLSASLRRGFDLSSEFPVRWIILHNINFQGGAIQTKYRLFAVGHHIAVDGSALSFLSKELLKYLNSTVDPSEDQGSLSYGEYVQRQNAYLRSTSGEAAKQFWMSQLTNTAPFSWQVPKPQACTDDYRRMHTWGFFPNEELQAWSRLYNTSWFRIASTIVSLVTTGSAEATPHHDRALFVAFGARPQEFQTCVSHMANTMPVKVPLARLLQDNSTFGEAVKAFGKNLSTAKKHEMFPFLSLVEEARKTMDERQLDLKVAVTFSPKLASKACRIYPVEGVWDLFFCFLEHDDGVSLGVIANPEVFGEEAMLKLRGQFMETAKLSQNDGTFGLRSLPFLQDVDMASIVNGPAIEDVEAISRSRVHLWIKERAAKQPEAIALSSAERGETMTYREVARKSSQIAHLLTAKGVAPSDGVLLHFSRGFNSVLWILGVLEAGAYYVVLDKALPSNRKQAIAATSDARFLVTDDFRIRDVLSDLSITVMSLDAIETELRTQPSTTLASAVRDDDLAYIIFTSGSTGQPKGVMVEHSNLSHYVSAARSVVKIGPGSRVLQFATFAFDASVLEWAVSLSYGATLCFVDHPELLVGDYLATAIDTNQINFFHTTPSVLATIPMERHLSALRMISVGGEASSAGLLGRWRERVRLLHAFGPTETTVIVTTEVIEEHHGSEASLPSPSLIGKPFPNSKILICGESDDIVLPQGEPGEICIAGPQVSRGYKGQPEMTQARFHTIHENGQETRLYRTGDRGFLDEDGKLFINGRMKNREIKLRGYRMDLYEIEKSILDHSPEARVASVQVHGDSLVAFIVPENAPCEIIRERLARDVPSYSVPSRFVPVQTLPLNPNGKVDHARVAEQLQELLGYSSTETPESQRRDSLMPKTETRETSTRHEASVAKVLKKLWMETLSLTAAPKPGATFFEAGGHSITLTELHKRITSRFPGCGVSLLDIFQAPTIDRQVECIINNSQPSPLAGSGSDEDSSASSSTDATSISDAPDDHNNNDDDDNKFAIVGMAGHFPGAADVDEFWQMLTDGRSGISTHADATAPTDLGPDEIFVPRYGSLPDSLPAFDPAAWNMTAEEAALTDPQKLHLLTTASAALADANIHPRATSTPHPIAVLVGAAPNTHKDAPGTPTPTSPFHARHRTLLDPPPSTFAAYHLNLAGPAATLNTACSSSLVALSHALAALLRTNRPSPVVDTALVAGVTLAFPRLRGYVTTPAGAGAVFSASGHCRPLDAGADGCVPADAVGAVVVKTLRAARRDGDAVYAVIEGCAVGSDGGGGGCGGGGDKVGFAVPSSAGQARVVGKAVGEAGADGRVRYVELHGSGTAVGDAVEVRGLERALGEVEGQEVQRRGGGGKGAVVHVGSNKGAFGNAEAASGMVSLIKMALAVANGVVPPMARTLASPNSMCGFEGRLRPLLGDAMKLAAEDRVGVTSLGYGGTNAHVVMCGAEVYGVRQRLRRV